MPDQIRKRVLERPDVFRRLAELKDQELDAVPPHSRRRDERLDRVAQRVLGVAQPMLHGDHLPEP
jgi:hypothetical protein